MKLLDIHVGPRDEAYAVGKNGLFLELSGSAWKTAAKSPLEKRALVAVAKHRGVLYVGAGAAGLLRREADGSLEVFDEDTYAVHLEAREALVVTEPHCITGTSDNEDFEATAEDMLAELTSSQPLARAHGRSSFLILGIHPGHTAGPQRASLQLSVLRTERAPC